jgi:prepilin-type N-terminal cleavage/methylation domain-containing protein
MSEKVSAMQATLERLRARREEMNDEGGFTLIELLIVIVILGILAAIVVFAVQNLTGSSLKASCQSDFKTVETAVEAYKAQVLNYPGGTTAAKPTDNDLNTVNAASALTGAGSELFVNDGTAPNIGTDATIGPWLKDVPTNSHYAVWVNNDGSGTVTVGAPTMAMPAPGQNSDTFCNTLS